MIRETRVDSAPKSRPLQAETREPLAMATSALCSARTTSAQQFAEPGHEITERRSGREIVNDRSDDHRKALRVPIMPVIISCCGTHLRGGLRRPRPEFPKILSCTWRRLADGVWTKAPGEERNPFPRSLKYSRQVRSARHIILPADSILSSS